MKHYVALKVLRNQHSELVCFLNPEGFSCGTRRIDECMIIDIVLLVLIVLLNFSLELKLPRGVGQSPLKSTASAGDIRQSRFQAVPWMLWAGIVLRELQAVLTLHWL